jgi:hypothetical protein
MAQRIKDLCPEFPLRFRYPKIIPTINAASSVSRTIMIKPSNIWLYSNKKQ